jgi:hypothetical protein
MDAFQLPGIPLAKVDPLVAGGIATPGLPVVPPVASPAPPAPPCDDSPIAAHVQVPLLPPPLPFAAPPSGAPPSAHQFDAVEPALVPGAPAPAVAVTLENATVDPETKIAMLDVPVRVLSAGSASNARSSNRASPTPSTCNT